MSEYSEAEQYEMAKHWVRVNGPWILAGIAIGALLPRWLALVRATPRCPGRGGLGPLRGNAPGAESRRIARAG